MKTPSAAIVTYNLKHFPEAALKPFGIEAKRPDEFLIDLYHIEGEIVVHEFHEQGAALSQPCTISEVLLSLETYRCTQFAQLIRESWLYRFRALRLVFTVSAEFYFGRGMPRLETIKAAGGACALNHRIADQRWDYQNTLDAEL